MSNHILQRDKILEWIYAYKRENNGNNPTFVEIADEFVIEPATARSHVSWLMANGKLVKHNRSYRVPMSTWELVI